MTNFEKHKEQLLEISNAMGTGIAVRNGELYPCENVRCEDCDFYNGGRGSCEASIIRWLYQEYEEKPKLSERAYHFLMSLPEGASIKYSSGFLYIKIEDTRSIYCAVDFFLPKLPQLLEAIWYEVSELLEWEVE